MKITAFLKLFAVQAAAVTLVAACSSPRDEDFIEGVEAARKHFYDHIEEFRALGEAIDAEDGLLEIQLCGNPLDRCEYDEVRIMLGYHLRDGWRASDPEKFANLLRALDIGHNENVSLAKEEITERSVLNPAMLHFWNDYDAVGVEKVRAGGASLIYDPIAGFPEHDCGKIIDRATESMKCTEGLSDGWALEFDLRVEVRDPKNLADKPVFNDGRE